MTTLRQWLGLGPAIGALTFLVGAAPAQAVVLDGKDWAQPADFTGFSWNEVATVCPVGGGACSGSIGVISFDGWTWATVQEVGSLFHAFEAAFPDNGIAVLPVAHGTVLETVFFADFVHTFITSHPDRLVAGWSATALIGANQAYAPVVVDRNTASPEPDTWSTDEPIGRTIVQGARGVWLYRGASVTVSEPPTYLLIGLVLAGVGLLRRAAPPIR